jgi:hypothetical protein
MSKYGDRTADGGLRVPRVGTGSVMWRQDFEA